MNPLSSSLVSEVLQPGLEDARLRVDVGDPHHQHGPPQVVVEVNALGHLTMGGEHAFTEIGKKAGLFAKLQPGRARKKINAT